MKDKELRGIVLSRFYELRREGTKQVGEMGFEMLPNFADLDVSEILRICDQLGKQDLIEWKSLPGPNGQSMGGFGQISPFGVDVVEGNTPAPIAITFMDNRQNLSIVNSQNVQVGNANVQDVNMRIGDNLMAAIDAAKGTGGEKREAKSLLQKALDNPLVKFAVEQVISALSKQGGA